MLFNKLSFCIRRICHHVEDKTVNIAPHTIINKSILGPYTNIAHHAEIINSSIGCRTSIGRYSFVRNANIGKYCSVSWRVTIGAEGHPVDRISGHAAFFDPRFGVVPYAVSKGKTPETRVGNDVWIGCDAIILAGVIIGDGAVIGAGSVVTKDIEPYTIYVGVPARKIGSRFDSDILQRLEKLKWWDLNDEVLKRNYQLFQKSMNEDLVKDLEQIITEIDE